MKVAPDAKIAKFRSDGLETESHTGRVATPQKAAQTEQPSTAAQPAADTLVATDELGASGAQPVPEAPTLKSSSLGLRLNPESAQAGAALLDLARRYLSATKQPAAGAVELLAQGGPAAQGLKLFAELFAEAKKSGLADAVFAQAMEHIAINTDTPVRDGSDDNNITLPRALGLAQNYAHELGYRPPAFKGLELQRDDLILVQADGSREKLGKVDAKVPRTEGGWLRELGRMLNEHHTGATTLVPPVGPLAAAAQQFDLDNAQLGVHLGNLAYKSPEVVRGQLEALGFNLDTLTFLQDAATDTQGFVVADPDGNLVTSFRGTSSFQDLVTDLKAAAVEPDWARGKGVEVHAGFDKAVSSVWPQFKKALAKVEAEVGHPPDGGLFAGHSLGGALTQLALTRAVHEGLIQPDAAQIYSVGTPRQGNEVYRRMAEKAAPRTFRMVNSTTGFGPDDDPITQIPPKFLGFRHAGNLVRLGHDDVEIVHMSDRTARARLESIAMRPGVRLADASGGGTGEDPTDPTMASVESMTEADYEAWLDDLAATSDANGATLEMVDGREARALAPQALIGRATGIDLHFLRGYLGKVGDEVLRRL